MNELLAIGLFYERSDGDFHANAFGVPLSTFVTENFKVLAAVGVEKEDSEHEEFGLGYDIHVDNFTIAPSG